MSHFEWAEFCPTAAVNVRKKMVALEESRGAEGITRAELDEAAMAIRSFAMLAQSHATLATIEEARQKPLNGV